MPVDPPFVREVAAMKTRKVCLRCAALLLAAFTVSVVLVAQAEPARAHRKIRTSSCRSPWIKSRSEGSSAGGSR